MKKNSSIKCFMILILLLSVFVPSCAKQDKPDAEPDIMQGTDPEQKTELIVSDKSLKAAKTNEAGLGGVDKVNKSDKTQDSQTKPAVEDKRDQANKIAGEFFKQPIPAGNYYFILRTALMFGTPWGGIPSDLEQAEKRVWDDLILSYESFRRNITVTDEDVSAEIEKTLKGHKVSFDWKEDKKAYADWTKTTIGGPVEFFENQIRHLVKLKKLQKEILDSMKPGVTEKEAYQEFLNEHNTLSVELVQFDELAKAREFYKKAKKSKRFWDKEKKREEQEIKKEEKQQKKKRKSKFLRPGFVALEFLMHMWKFPQDAVYEMIEMKVGSIYPPAPIYKGYGVFKIIEIRRAKKEDFDKYRESYYNQIKTRKKYQGFNEWLANMHKEGNVKKYIKVPENIF